MERPTCGTCPYWRMFKEAIIGQGREGECHVNPPTFTTQPMMEEMTDEPFEGFWPEIRSTEFCGEHPDFPAYIKEQRKARLAAQQATPEYKAAEEERSLRSCGTAEDVRKWCMPDYEGRRKPDPAEKLRDEIKQGLHDGTMTIERARELDGLPPLPKP